MKYAVSVNPIEYHIVEIIDFTFEGALEFLKKKTLPIRSTNKELELRFTSKHIRRNKVP